MPKKPARTGPEPGTFSLWRLTQGEKKAVLQRLRQLLALYPGVRFAYVHGSFLEDRPCRDLDLAVYLAGASAGQRLDLALAMGAELSHELGLPVDVHSLNEASVPFAYEVLRRGKLLFCRDREEAFGFAERILALYRDFLPLLEAGYRDLLTP
jgi:predicted nucleotidyltransferase